MRHVASDLAIKLFGSPTPEDLCDAGHLIVRLSILAEGCLDHPEYRANSVPKDSCRHCNFLWSTKQAIFFKEADTRRRFDPERL